MADGATLTGGCLCGGVRFAFTRASSQVVNCHCSQCRRFHGHFGPYVTIAMAGVRFDAEASLTWYQSSAKARRGFCGVCGASLFWQKVGGEHLDVAAGSLDPPTGLATIRHIFVADKSDYYTIDDALERHAGAMPGST
ncbi:MAG: GFA family protein [Alphaproteobacteria bacterium]